MDTKTFLNTILPARGIKFAQRIKPRPGKKDATILYPVADNDDLADKLLELDTGFDNDNVYYAMASYKEAKYKTHIMPDGKPFEYVVGRTQDNALYVKSLWFDLDVGKTDSYATQREAVGGISEYCKATNLPLPLIVSSGYGIHCYWVFCDEIDAAEWDGVAKYQRAAWRHLGIKVDPACDQDCARVLRAPGCRNKKAGKEPKMVRVLRGEVTPLPAMEYKRRLRAYVEANDLGVMVKPDTPEWAKVSKGNLEGAVTEFPDSFAAIAVQHCQQMQNFRDTGGSSEPIWWANVGLLKHFKDGKQLAHEWSAKHETYDEGETDSKMETWKFGPTTCDKFKELNADLCQGCVHKCKSPVQLGLTEEIQKPNLNEIAASAKVISEDSAIAAMVDADNNGLPLGWPDGYGYDKVGDRVTKKVLDPNGVWQDVAIATPLFYPVEQVKDEDGTFFFKMHMWVRGRVREFNLQTKYTADPRSLKMQLHANQIHVLNDKATGSYLSYYMTDMQRKQAETETYRQMGWKHDFKAWLIGDTLITEKETRQVALSKSFSTERRSLYDPKGDPNRWVHAVDTLFNREHGEPYQFAICAAFAAPLHALLGFSEWRGIPFALTTDESGFGKTTVNMIANSIWYDPEKGKVSNSTAKAVLGIASEFNHLPFLLDEVTSYLKDPADMGDLLYAMSNGRGREGMDGGGRLRDNSPPWTGVCALTGNRNILLQIAENKLNPEAMQMRVFEIDLDTYPRIATMEKGTKEYKEFNDEHRLLAQTLVTECSGVIGTEYIRYVMANLDDIKARLRKVSMGMAKFMDGGDATKERFYYHLITTVLVGGWIAKKMGFINFDLNNLRDWCVNHVKRIRGHAREARRTPQDHFAALMSDLVGRIIVTKNFESLDQRKGKTEMHLSGTLRTPVCGRYVIGDEKERTQLYVTVGAVQAWCVEQGLSYNSIRRDFMNEGLIRLANKNVNRNTGAVRVSIGKGVAGIHDLGNHVCLEINTEKVGGLLVPTKPAEVVELVKEMA